MAKSPIMLLDCNSNILIVIILGLQFASLFFYLKF
jgi:hypothetical protein